MLREVAHEVTDQSCKCCTKESPDRPTTHDWWRLSCSPVRGWGGLCVCQEVIGCRLQSALCCGIAESAETVCMLSPLLDGSRKTRERLTSPGWSRKWNRCSDRTLTLGCWTKFGANAEGKLTFVILQGIVAFVRLFRCWLQPCLGLRMSCNNSPRSAFASRAPTAIVRARVCDGFVALPLWLQGVQRSKRGRRSVRNCAAKLKTCAWTSRKGPCKASGR